MWLSSCCNANPFVLDADPYVVFDLGAVYNVTSIDVWNYNEGAPNLTNRGVNAVSIEYGNTLTFGTSGSGFGSTLAGVTNFSQANGLNTYAGESFNAIAPFEAQYIKFDINSNHGGDSFGLSEVQFNGTLVSPSVAPVEITPVGVTASSEIPGFNRLAAYTIDNSGLDILGRHSVAPDANMWLSSGAGQFGGVDPDPQITFDLGSIVDIGDIQVWNYNEGVSNLTNRGVDEVDILVSDDGINFTQVLNTNFDIAPGTATDFSQLISLDATGQYVRFDIVSNHGDASSFFGLSEVKFFEAQTVVPEPASVAIWSLIGLGFASFGAWRVQRKK